MNSWPRALPRPPAIASTHSLFLSFVLLWNLAILACDGGGPESGLKATARQIYLHVHNACEMALMICIMPSPWAWCVHHGVGHGGTGSSAKEWFCAFLFVCSTGDADGTWPRLS